MTAEYSAVMTANDRPYHAESGVLMDHVAEEFCETSERVLADDGG